MHSSPFLRGLPRNWGHPGLHMPSMHKPGAVDTPAPFPPSPHLHAQTGREATPRTLPRVPLPLRAPCSCGPFQAHGGPAAPLQEPHMAFTCERGACHGCTYFILFFCILYGFIWWSICVWVLIIRYDKMVSHVLPPCHDTTDRGWTRLESIEGWVLGMLGGIVPL